MLFSLATFDRVYDVSPKRDRVDLLTLARALTTFIVKQEVLREVERELSHVEKAYEAAMRGALSGGRLSRAFAGAKNDQERSALRVQLEKAARARAKSGLRLWSPAEFREGSRRESEDVLWLSCLVLDYDNGGSPEDAARLWPETFCIVHSTWSHSTATPKFRVILPLRSPVHAGDWREFWSWAAKRVGQRNDPALKSPASTYALPVTPSLDHPRVAFVQGGELLAKEESKLSLRNCPTPPATLTIPPSHFRGNLDSETVSLTPSNLKDCVRLTELQPDDDDFRLFDDGISAVAKDDWTDEFDF